MIWAYAITERAAAGDGIDGAPLECLGAGRVHAVVSRHASVRTAAAAEQMRAHAGVVERLMEAGPVLPLRYGTVLADERPLLAALSERGHEFGVALDRVRDRVEMAVSVPAADEPARSPAASGRDYLMAKVARRRAAAERARELAGALGPLVHERRERLDPGDGFALKAAYLIDGGVVPEFERRVRTLEGAVCTGPWPPYSFATGDEE